MPVDRIAQLIGKALGFDLQIMGEAVLIRAIRRRMEAHQLDQAEDYLPRVQHSPQELAELVEELVVPETWFFRDEEAFTILADYAFHRWGDYAQSRPLRVLSIPCSTGEEPYSIAMALFRRNWPADRLWIDAMDISKQAIVKAKAGCYRNKSFRTSDLSFRDQFFTATTDGYLVQERIRASVHFHQDNLLHHPFSWQWHEGYDVIFCRNLLIYLDTGARHKVIAILLTLIRPQGLLVTGPAEAVLFSGAGFEQFPGNITFALLRSSGVTTEPFPQQPPLPLPPVPSADRPDGGTVAGARDGSGATDRMEAVSRAPGMAQERPIGRENHGSSSETYLRHTPRTGLAEARRLIEAGVLTEAAALCRNHIDRHGPDPEAYFLYGRARLEAGKLEEAFTLLRKAAYLDPACHEAIILLAVVAEGLGDKRGAANYRRRARKLNAAGDRKK